MQVICVNRKRWALWRCRKIEFVTKNTNRKWRIVKILFKIFAIGPISDCISQKKKKKKTHDAKDYQK